MGGVAALVLMRALHRLDVRRLLRWLILNQGEGFKGRPEKPCDSCYSFWIGAVLSILSSYEEQNVNVSADEEKEKEEKVDWDWNGFLHSDSKSFYNLCSHRENRVFNLRCQSGFGGFAKLPHIPYGDILHGYMGLAGLAMMKHQRTDKVPTAEDYEEFPNLFRKTMYPLTSSTVSRADIKSKENVES